MSGGHELREFRVEPLPCKRCGLGFISSATEQAFLGRVGLGAPTYCKTSQTKMRRESARQERVSGR